MEYTMNAAIEKLNEIMSEPMAWNFWTNPNYLRQTREFRMVVEGEQ